MITLRPVLPTDAPTMFAWMQDDDVRSNIGLRSEPTLERTVAWIADSGADEARAIVADGRHVGNVVLDQIDRWVGTARLSIYVGTSADRGRGIGRAAVALMLDVAFDELALAKVWLTVHARNGRAISAYVACGFSVEGVHRAEFMLRGERVDQLYMGILSGDRRGADAVLVRGRRDRRPAGV